MSLHASPLLYVFYDCFDIPGQRDTLERAVGLPVVEVEAHQPHHSHGVVKYDAGGTILSLNRSTEAKFPADVSDALVTVLAVDPEWRIADRVRPGWSVTMTHACGPVVTDPSGHHWGLRPMPERAGEISAPTVDELRLAVDDIEISSRFYRDAMGLEQAGRTPTTASFRTGSVPLVLEQRERAVDGRALQRRTCLLVFHTPDIAAMRDALEQRGVAFGVPRAGYSDIGGTIRFEDPSGHRFCLYEPSEASLSWGSGPKVREIVGGAVAVA